MHRPTSPAPATREPSASGGGGCVDANSPTPQSSGALWMPYCQMKTAPPPIYVAATRGTRLVLHDGRELIDGLSSWWCAVHGYNHPHVTAKMSEQLARMPHVMLGGIRHDGAVRLAERLSERLPGDLSHVFFSDSGSVAIEVAMKMALQYQQRLGHVRRTRFVAFDHAYHGDTTGAMSLCDPHVGMHAGFADAVMPQHHLPLPVDEPSRERLERLLADHAEEIAGVFLEPLVQGAGGMRFHDPSTVVSIRQACDRHGVLMIADEIATGFGRTGSMFAIDQCRHNGDPVVPDIVCLGKALTAGMTGMAATVARTGVFDAFWSDDPAAAFMHGPTFMANPLACAAANASLDLFDCQPRLRQAQEIESVLTERLAAAVGLPGVVDVRCRGAIGVIQVERIGDVHRLRRRLTELGVWLRPFADVIYTTPPLTVQTDDLITIADAMVRVTDEMGRWSGSGDCDAAAPV